METELRTSDLNGIKLCKKMRLDKDIVMEDVKSFNKISLEIHQKTRDDQMTKLRTNNPDTDELWNVRVKKSMQEAVRFVETWKPKILHPAT